MFINDEILGIKRSGKTWKCGISGEIIHDTKKTMREILLHTHFYTTPYINQTKKETSDP